MNSFYSSPFAKEYWIIDGVIWAIGLFFWIVTYVGAPIASKKRGKNVSGVPGAAFVSFLVAGLFSPYNLLALIALTDVQVFMIPIMLLKGKTSKKE